LSDTAGEKLITRCTEAEATPFEAIMLRAERLRPRARGRDQDAHGRDGRAQRHGAWTHWKTVCAKYGLKDVGNYVVRRIDGRPFIVELA
jgi:hypothetical protein